MNIITLDTYGNSLVYLRDPPKFLTQPADTVVCEGTAAYFTIKVKGEKPLKFAWYKDGISIPEGTHYSGTTTTVLTINNASAADEGMYFCVAIDHFSQYQESAHANLKINAKPLQGIIITHPLTCDGGAGLASLRADLSQGADPYTIEWTGPMGFTAKDKTDITNLVNIGKYIARVTDNLGCTNKDSVSVVSVFANPYVYVTPISSGDYNVSCEGATDGKMKVAAYGGITFPYRFRVLKNDFPLDSGIFTNNYSSADPSTFRDYTNLGAGVYTLIITDKNGCERMLKTTFKVPPPVTVKFRTSRYWGGYNVSCRGYNDGSVSVDSVSGGRGGYSFRWFTRNGNLQGDVNSDRIDSLKAGIYYLETTDISGLHVCARIDSVIITQPDGMWLSYSKTLSDFNSFNISCSGRSDGSISIDPVNGITPFHYSWKGPEGFTSETKDISGLKAGEYLFSIADSNLCIAKETIILKEPGPLGVTFNLSDSRSGGFNINCAGEATGTINTEPLNFVKDVEYIWADGGTGKTRYNIPAGNYSLIITDSNNCQVTSAVTLTEPDSMKLTFEVKKAFCKDTHDGAISLSVSGGVKGTDYLYRWSGNNGQSSITEAHSGLYSVTVEDMNGCQVKDSVVIEVENGGCLIIPNVISPNGDLINDVWNIGNSEFYPLMDVRIFNRWGEIIWRSENGYPKPWDGRSSGSELPVDSYHYVIDLKNGSRPLPGIITIVR